MARRKASSGNSPTKPKVHVTHTGGMYSPRGRVTAHAGVREVIKRMAQIAEDADKH